MQDKEKTREQLITELRAKDKVLMASNARLRAIIENNPDGMIVIDKDGIIRFINEATMFLFKRKREELLGKPFPIPLTDGDSSEINIIRTSGEIGTVGVADMRVVKMEWEGKPASLVMVHDITEFKKVEQLKAEVKQYEQIDKLKDEFVSTVSHELRTPLTSIKNSVDLILKEKTGEINNNQKRFLFMAERNIKSLGNLIEDLLCLSKIESGKIELHKTLVNIPGLIKNIVSEFECLAQEKKIHLDYKLPYEKIDAFADEDRIREVLLNLVSNAMKFTPEGGRINVFTMDDAKEVVICVQDSGIGIARDDIPKLFGKFTQFHRESAPGAKGTGLGLAICKGIIEMHKSRIWVETEPGKGSKFCFSLPKLDREEIFKEHLFNEIEKTRESGGCFSVIILSMINFKELIQEFPEKEKEIFRDLEDLVNDTLRKKADIVVIGKGEILIILPHTAKEKAVPVLDRIKDIVEVFISEREEIMGRCTLVADLVSYPDDGEDEEELLNRLGMTKNLGRQDHG